MTEFRPFVISALLLGLLAFAMINIGIMMTYDNNGAESIGNDSSISTYSNTLRSSLENASQSAIDADNSFRNSTVSLTGGVIFVDAIGGLWKTLTTVPSTVLTLTSNVLKNRLMGDTVYYAVFGVISLILVITLIIAVWKLVGTGEGG